MLSLCRGNFASLDCLSAFSRRSDLLVLIVLVEVQVDGGRVVKYEIIVAVRARRNVYIRAGMVDVHYVVDNVAGPL